MLKLQSVSLKVALTALVASATLLSGCATPSGNCDLISLKLYDREFQSELATQLEVLPPTSPLASFVTDSVNLRDEIRDCQGA